VDADTDLIPGLYEGGLKTWEGGVDLLEVLAEGGALPEGKRVLEVSHSLTFVTLCVTWEEYGRTSAI
jgi:hypothetical protein